MKSFFNKALRILLFTNFLILVSGAMLGPIYALFVEEIGGNLLDASITGGLFALAAGIVSLFSGRLTDKTKNPKKIVIIGYLLIAGGFFSYSIVNSILCLFAIQLIIGAGEALYSPAFDALYSKHLVKTKRGREWGAWESMNYFSIAIGAIVGGLVVNAFGFKSVFYIMGTISLISAIFLLFTKNGEI